MNDTDKSFLKYNFFVISSDNLDEVTPRLYGYAIFDEKGDKENYNIYINGAVNNVPSHAVGTYINISRSDDTIKIQQDCNGGYGLYLFKSNDFFAISNSYLYLLEYLKNHVDLSLNIDFAKYYITDELASLSVSETLVNEIELLPKDIEVEINLSKKKLETKNLQKDINKVPLGSTEGVAILDDWHKKWQSILMTLQKNDEKIKVDLTGGMDSRATLAVFNSSAIDLNKVQVNSSTDGLHTHKEDFEVASMIAKRLDFKLNQPIDLNTYPLQTETAIKLASFAKLGIHKQLFLKNNYQQEKLFYFTGYGGESIRSHWAMPPRTFITRRMAFDRFASVDCKTSIDKIISKSMDNIRKRYGADNDTDVMKYFYASTRLRSHFGKHIVENFLTNVFCLNPLMDPVLQRVRTDDDTLLCTIYERYLSEINDIKFEGGRKLKSECIDKAQQITKLFPYQANSRMNGAEVIDGTAIHPKRAEQSPVSPRQKMIDIYYSGKIKLLITELFGYEIYQKGKLNWERGGFVPELLAGSLIAVATTMDAINTNKGLFDISQTKQYFSNSKLIAEVLKVFNTARIDIKNVGSNKNDITFEPKGLNSKITSPNWFRANGKGYVFESKQSSLDFDLTCVNDGELKVILKGLDGRDEKNQAFPMRVNYTSCKVNGVEKISNPPISCHHDKPKFISQKVKDGETLHISIQWEPYDYNQDEFVAMVEKIYKVLPFSIQKMN